MNYLVDTIEKEMDVLNKMIEENYGDINTDSILEQSMKLDKYIVEYLKINRNCH